MDVPSLEREYVSRRTKNYNDGDSSNEEEEGDSNKNGYKNSGAIVYKDTKGRETTLKPNSRFLNYKENFQNLMVTQVVVTMYPLTTMAISYDSTKALTVTKKDDMEVWVKMYDLNTGDLTFEEKIGGQPDQYIKCKELE